MKNIFIILVVSAMVMFFSCDNETIVKPITTGEVSIADVHTDFLQAVFENVDAVNPDLLKSANEEIILYQTAKEITDKYGVETLTREQICQSLERGRKMAMQDPVELVKSILPPDQYKWWDTFASEATAESARIVYNKMCKIYGVPKPGTFLADLVDITLSSAEFWLNRHPAEEDPEIYYDYNRTLLKGWRKNLLRFTVSVVVDGAAGAAAGSGTGGNVVIAGVVGGLCSYAADNMLFGD